MTPNVSFRIVNEDEFRREWARAMNDGVVGGLRRGVDMGCKEGAAEALSTRRWKDRTGETAKATTGGLEMIVPGGALGYMECAVDHASYLADGTEDHVIRPKAVRGSAKASRYKGQGVRSIDDIGTTRVALRWYDTTGAVHFAREVHVKGIKPDPFFANAYLKCERVVIRETELGVVHAQAILDS